LWLGFGILLVGGACRQEEEYSDGDLTEITCVMLEIRNEIGVEAGDSNYVFGFVSDVVRTDSLIYVVDFAKAHIAVYDNRGAFVRYIGGRGSGPGEFTAPVKLLLSGDKLLVQDVNGLLMLSRQGEQLSYILQHEGNVPRQHVLVDDTTFCVAWHEFILDDEPLIRPFIGIYDISGAKIAELWSDIIKIPVAPKDNNDALNTLLFGHYFASDGKGHIYLHQRHTHEYRILCYNREGELCNEIVKDCELVRKTEEEIALEKQYVEDMLQGWGTSNVIQWVYEPDEYREPIGGLWVNGDGNLWVLDGSERTPTFDVWSVPEGEILYRAVLPVDIPLGDFITFYITPHCSDIAAVYEDMNMVQKVLLIDLIH